jgi:hypothetical protein
VEPLRQEGARFREETWEQFLFSRTGVERGRQFCAGKAGGVISIGAGRLVFYGDDNPPIFFLVVEIIVQSGDDGGQKDRASPHD